MNSCGLPGPLKSHRGHRVSARLTTEPVPIRIRSQRLDPIKTLHEQQHPVKPPGTWTEPLHGPRTSRYRSKNVPKWKDTEPKFVAGQQQLGIRNGVTGTAYVSGGAVRIASPSEMCRSGGPTCRWRPGSRAYVRPGGRSISRLCCGVLRAARWPGGRLSGSSPRACLPAALLVS